MKITFNYKSIIRKKYPLENRDNIFFIKNNIERNFLYQCTKENTQECSLGKRQIITDGNFEMQKGIKISKNHKYVVNLNKHPLYKNTYFRFEYIFLN